MLEFFLLIALVVIFAFPLGKYLSDVMQYHKMRSDILFSWIEKPVYAVLGTQPQQEMSARTYILSFVLSCFVVGMLVWILFMVQAWLPLNPNLSLIHI